MSLGSWSSSKLHVRKMHKKKFEFCGASLPTSKGNQTLQGNLCNFLRLPTAAFWSILAYHASGSSPCYKLKKSDTTNLKQIIYFWAGMMEGRWGGTHRGEVTFQESSFLCFNSLSNLFSFTLSPNCFSFFQYLFLLLVHFSVLNKTQSISQINW